MVFIPTTLGPSAASPPLSLRPPPCRRLPASGGRLRALCPPPRLPFAASPPPDSRWPPRPPSAQAGKRPVRLALLFLGLVSATFAAWDRLFLVRDCEAEILRLGEEVNRLHDQLRNAGIYLDENRKNGNIMEKSTLLIMPGAYVKYAVSNDSFVFRF
ncbi:hypothetical protein GUJ93_ZPchr0014g46823 [Zizania palustris]|uniref:Uncharacterized protein n=1 Tax=Zizania palustris TaxID=103762 RepID=A0A8J5W6V0_ZIZPA|nr:hypothetical protein GUJ93_ZPchr0014g46823 [Zizania palustris]